MRLFFFFKEKDTLLGYVVVKVHPLNMTLVTKTMLIKIIIPG